MQISSLFSLVECTKKGQQKVTEMLYFTQPNSSKIGIWVEVADIIHYTKLGNDRSREYKVTEGRI